MIRLIVGGLAIVAVGLGALWWALTPLAPPASMLAAPSVDEAAVARGAYLARLGDCGACHTGESGKEMAGGLAFDTPMGRIYSTNITPDPKTGIGGYTLAEFEGALRRGINANGENLYPAMPYPSFAKITDDDVTSLYAYFMKGRGSGRKDQQAQRHALPLQYPAGARALEDRLFRPSPIRRRSVEGAAMESRRLHRRGPWPLRSLPHAARNRHAGGDDAPG